MFAMSLKKADIAAGFSRVGCQNMEKSCKNKVNILEKSCNFALKIVEKSCNHVIQEDSKNA